MISAQLDDLSLSELSRVKLTLFDLDSVMNDLEKLTDREVGIIAGSLLDGMMEQAIRSRFARDDADLFDGIKSLSGMGAKIGLAYSLGLLSEQSKGDIDGINKIRNALAHSSRHINFLTRAIADRCRSFNITNMESYMTEVHPFNIVRLDTPHEGIFITDDNGNVGMRTRILEDKSPRSLFINCARLNILLLFLATELNTTSIKANEAPVGPNAHG